MSKIREHAKAAGHTVVGRLRRIPEKEYNIDPITGDRVHSGAKFYVDEAKNEYWVSRTGVCIVDAEGTIVN